MGRRNNYNERAIPTGEARATHLSWGNDVLRHERRSFWVVRLQFQRCEDVCGEGGNGEGGLSKKCARSRLEPPGPTLVRADVQSSRQSGLRSHQARLRRLRRRQFGYRQAGLNRVLYERSRAATTQPATNAGGTRDIVSR